MKTLTSNDFGKKFLVENCHKIQIKDFLNKYKVEFKRMMIEAELKVLGIDIELTTSKTCFKGIRFWFKCPICKARIGVLYKHPLNQKIGCRKCLNLDYTKHCFKGMVESQVLLDINDKS